MANSLSLLRLHDKNCCKQWFKKKAVRCKSYLTSWPLKCKWTYLENNSSSIHLSCFSQKIIFTLSDPYSRFVMHWLHQILNIFNFRGLKLISKFRLYLFEYQLMLFFMHPASVYLSQNALLFPRGLNMKSCDLFMVCLPTEGKQRISE